MKNYKVILSWLGILLYLFIALSFVNKKEKMALCNTIKVNIADSLDNKFIVEQDILDFINEQNLKVRGYSLKDINTHQLEEMVIKFPAVKNVECYKTIEGTLAINLNQRKPIVRVMDAKNNSYYIDNDGYILPLSNQYTAHVIVANGKIPEIDFRNKKVNVLDAGKNGRHKELLKLKDIYLFSKHISNDDFWKAQFVQLYVNSDNEYELIPRVGAHIILLGKMEDFEYKLKKLKALYFKGLNKEGWNNYERINLKYSNQVVCTKR
jgi:cell division protein FtsQ